MANVLWVGAAQAVPDAKRLTVTGSTPGTSYGFDANGRTVRYLAVTGDTVSSVAAGIMNAAAQSTDGRIRELTIQQNTSDAFVFDVTGVYDGKPITGWSVTTGVSSATLSTATGPNHADNVLNYSTGALPSGGDTLTFSGLTVNDGPKYALDALSAVTLALVDVLPDFAGTIGLPDQDAAGYTQFRTKYFQAKSAAHRVRSNTQDTPGRFRFNCGAVVTAFQAAGPGGSQGVYPVHLYNAPSTSTLSVTGYGVATAPEAGQTAVFASVTATLGSAVNLTQRTTPGAVVLDGSAAVVDCQYASLAIRGNSQVLGGVNASCSTGTGIACTVDAGLLDWRAAAKPADEVSVGTGATLVMRNAVGTVPALTALWRYENSTFDDITGRMTVGYPMKFVRCSPQSCTTLMPEHITLTSATLP